jgi:hypothetical protein
MTTTATAAEVETVLTIRISRRNDSLTAQWSTESLAGHFGGTTIAGIDLPLTVLNGHIS